MLLYLFYLHKAEGKGEKEGKKNQVFYLLNACASSMLCKLVEPAANALNIVMQVQEKGNGFEAWRLLHKEHKPQIAGQFFFLREVSTAHTCAGGEHAHRGFHINC